MANGSALGIQNTTWNGKQGFQRPPKQQLIVDGQNSGVVQSERGLTFVRIDNSGHMVPQDQPKVAYKLQQYLLGQISLKDFTVQDQLSVLPNNVDTSSDAFKDNRTAMTALVEEYDSLHARIALGGPEKARQRHLSRGKMLARDRVGALLDAGSPFLELSTLAGGWDMYGKQEDEVPGGGMITGIGTVSGTQTLVVANDPTVKGGSYYPISVKKHLRAQQIARENRLPCVYLVESGGAALPHQAEVFPDAHHFGRIFAEMAQMSALGIPQISVVHGISVAGGAYVPAMADENIIVRQQGTIFLAGPPLVKAALGEDVDDETLGGGEMHCTQSGVTDHLAIDDAHAIALAREAVANLGRAGGQVAVPGAQAVYDAPLYDPAELHGIVPTNLRQPFDMRDVIARIVDGSRFHEFKKLFGPTMVTGFASIGGQQVGIIANNGILFSALCTKGNQLRTAVQPTANPAGVLSQRDRLHGRHQGGDGRNRQGRRKDGSCCGGTGTCPRSRSSLGAATERVTMA
ncbi:hypothetical protein IEQ34_025166 [Dendrobium chrysotoxum]|uniref:methylcrotonoyl-CoA carboxylase n=1 Tax=Dendrobium chrysotoxum TaxID=161865 RepID=A0AAV7FQZ0_DENCH|nr:hypothetical protein IEQ34_025166 [Dendrobium chrysotoxum]